MWDAIPSLTPMDASGEPSLTFILIHPHPPCSLGIPGSFPPAPTPSPLPKPSAGAGCVVGGVMMGWGTLGSFGKHRPTTYLKMVLVLAKLRMGPRTMSIPRSSEALSWREEAAWIRIPSRGCSRGWRDPVIPSHSHSPPTPWSQTRAPGRAAWRRRGWWMFYRYRGGHKGGDAGAGPR